MPCRSKGLPRSTPNPQSADSACIIAAVFESRPDESLVSSDALSILYSQDCSDAEAQDRAYHCLLPLIKRQVSVFKANLRLQTSGDFRIACAVCPQPTLFKGWSALHIHAQKYWKCFPHQHQGYSKALTEVLQAEKLHCLAVAATTDGLAWPPVLLVDNGAGKTTFDGSLRRWKGLQGMDVPCTLSDMELEEVLAIYKTRKGDDREVVVYPSSEIGLLDADKLTDALEKSPPLASCLKVRVLKAEDQLKSSSAGSICADDAQGGRKTFCCEFDDKPMGATHSEYDHEKHQRLGTWASLKEIRDSGRVNAIMGKWANGFAVGKERSFVYKWPFQKSKKLREMDSKFQESLHEHRQWGDGGNERLKVQFDEIEKQLKKERLLWLKEISRVQEQFEEFNIKLSNEEAQKDLNRCIVQMKLEKAMDKRNTDEVQELFARKLKHGGALRRKKQQVVLTELAILVAGH